MSFKQTSSLWSFSLVTKPGAGVTLVLKLTQLMAKGMIYSGFHTPCTRVQVGIVFEEPSLKLYSTLFSRLLMNRILIETNLSILLKKCLWWFERAGMNNLTETRPARGAFLTAAHSLPGPRVWKARRTDLESGGICPYLRGPASRPALRGRALYGSRPSCRLWACRGAGSLPPRPGSGS